MAKPTIDTAFGDDIVAMFEQDTKPSDIADQLRISVVTVYRVLKDRGLNPVRREKNPGGLTNEQVENLIKMYLEGDDTRSGEGSVPVSEITATFNIGYSTFYRILSEAGIDLKSKSDDLKEQKLKRLEEAIKFYQEGLTYSQIEARTEVPQTRLTRELRRRGITLRSER